MRPALLEELIAMAIPGKLEVTLKINNCRQAKTDPAQTVLFAVQAEGATVVVELKNKTWNHLKTAAETLCAVGRSDHRPDGGGD